MLWKTRRRFWRFLAGWRRKQTFPVWWTLDRFRVFHAFPYLLFLSMSFDLTLLILAISAKGFHIVFHPTKDCNWKSFYLSINIFYSLILADGNWRQAEAWNLLLAETFEMNALAQRALRPFTQWLYCLLFCSTVNLFCFVCERIELCAVVYLHGRRGVTRGWEEGTILRAPNHYEGAESSAFAS